MAAGSAGQKTPGWKRCVTPSHVRHHRRSRRKSQPISRPTSMTRLSISRSDNFAVIERVAEIALGRARRSGDTGLLEYRQVGVRNDCRSNVRSLRRRTSVRFHACSIDTPRRREKKPAGQAGKVSGRKRSDRERQGNLFNSPTPAKIVQLRHRYAPEASQAFVALPTLWECPRTRTSKERFPTCRGLG